MYRRASRTGEHHEQESVTSHTGECRVCHVQESVMYRRASRTGECHVQESVMYRRESIVYRRASFMYRRASHIGERHSRTGEHHVTYRRAMHHAGCLEPHGALPVGLPIPVPTLLSYKDASPWIGVHLNSVQPP